MTPSQKYNADIAKGIIYPDAEQQKVVLALQAVYEQLVPTHSKNLAGFTRQLLKIRHKPVRGLYLWGSVGVGKTYLMDLFFHSLPHPRKLRLHFHAFMAEVHKLLQQLQGERNPLDKVAASFASKAHVLCLDEFIVNDIGDAMILANLLQGLFQRGVCLVSTSNVVPSQLYKNGLQRTSFLPAIALLEQHTEVLHLPNQQDYRLRHLAQVGVYFSPLDKAAEQHLQSWFAFYAKEVSNTKSICVLNRYIKVVQEAKDVVWFGFDDLCYMPRSQNDYLELAKRYKALLVSEIPQFTAYDSDRVMYLINLVDICYDWRLKLIVSAAVPIQELYTEGRLVFEFQRTRSRLLEMQSKQYLDSR
jgi:cell division protein ZapE